MTIRDGRSRDKSIPRTTPGVVVEGTVSVKLKDNEVSLDKGGTADDPLFVAVSKDGEDISASNPLDVSDLDVGQLLCMVLDELRVIRFCLQDQQDLHSIKPGDVPP